VIAQRGPSVEQARLVCVLLHGRGRDVEDVLSLADRMAVDDVCYLAPAAPGGSWYPLSFLAPVADNEPALSEALAVVDSLVRSVDRARLVLGGFSQGACLASEYALRHPGRYAGLLLYTGGFIGPRGTEAPDAGGFDGTPVYMGTSDPDDWVPVWRVRETADALSARGAAVTLDVFPGMDHLVNDAEIAAGRTLLRA
jgi:predicted esterase